MSNVQDVRYYEWAHILEIISIFIIPSIDISGVVWSVPGLIFGGIL